LVLGLTSFSVGTLMLVIGLVMRTKKMPGAGARSVITGGEERERLSDTNEPVWLALGVMTLALALMLIVGHALHRAKRR
jgi:hypothetical protein